MYLMLLNYMLKMFMTVNFMLRVFYHNLKKTRYLSTLGIYYLYKISKNQEIGNI